MQHLSSGKDSATRSAQDEKETPDGLFRFLERCVHVLVDAVRGSLFRWTKEAHIAVLAHEACGKWFNPATDVRGNKISRQQTMTCDNVRSVS